jgi:two-component system, sensor histidine kinase RegB
MIPGSSRTDPRIALPWIVRLRYAMAAGQAVTCVLVDRILGIDLPLGWLMLPPALVAFSNLWLARRAERVAGAERESAVIGWIFVLDTLCLTAALMLAGGPNNPFSLLYLVHITLAAAILNQRQTWALGALACVCFGLLFWNPLPITSLEMHPHHASANLHLVGMWIAFTVASALVAIFSGRISELLRVREQSLLRMQEELAKKDRLASLVTLAAGAAHELSTPLGTIAVVAKELEHYAMHTAPDGAIAEDSRLIRHEVDRCSEILQRMSLAGAEPVGEAIEEVSPRALLDAVRRVFASRHEVMVEDLVPESAGVWLRLPRHAIEQALFALVKNGLDAGAGSAPVVLTARACDTASVCFEVKDSGMGMTAETLRRAGEPFFTTKEPGSGMGLGVFLVRTLAERLNGRFELSSEPGRGTRASLELPCHSVRQPAETESRR